MKRDARDALALALEQGIAEPGAKNSWLFHNAFQLPQLGTEWKEAFHCEQEFRPEYLNLQRSQYSVDARIESKDFRKAMVLLYRSKVLNQHSIARLFNALPSGGQLVVAGNKTDGIASIRKWLSSQIDGVEGLSKFHAVVLWLTKNQAQHLSAPQVERQIDAYHVAEGMFSSEGPDRGSLLLAEHFSNRIRGTVADLGAGWGFLSDRLCGSSDRIDRLDLYEASYNALDAARKNVRCSDSEMTFNWIDVTSEFPKKPYDWVIMNPPFHSGRAAEPRIGQRFIEVAASTLVKGGRLLMVANRNLPYEKTLQSNFRAYEKLAERDGFKVLEAVK